MFVFHSSLFQPSAMLTLFSAINSRIMKKGHYCETARIGQFVQHLPTPNSSHTNVKHGASSYAWLLKMLLTSTETIRTVRDSQSWMAVSTFPQLLSYVDFHTAPEICGLSLKYKISTITQLHGMNSVHPSVKPFCLDGILQTTEALQPNLAWWCIM